MMRQAFSLLFLGLALAPAYAAEQSSNPFGALMNYPANNCELFIDKAANVYTEQFGRSGPHAEATLNLFIKILPGRLDSQLRSVSFYGQHLTTGKYDYIQAQSWNGAKDYFKIEILDEMIGSFYVETLRGTRYWFNAQNGQNFHFDEQVLDQLDKTMGFFGDKYPEQGPPLEVAKLPKTADSFKEWNPEACK